MVYESKIQKAIALRGAILERLVAGDDIEDAWAPLVPIKAIPFDLEVSLEQVNTQLSTQVAPPQALTG